MNKSGECQLDGLRANEAPTHDLRRDPNGRSSKWCPNTSTSTCRAWIAPVEIRWDLTTFLGPFVPSTHWPHPCASRDTGFTSLQSSMASRGTKREGFFWLWLARISISWCLCLPQPISADDSVQSFVALFQQPRVVHEERQGPCQLYGCGLWPC